jgi:hypothetical protein
MDGRAQEARGETELHMEDPAEAPPPQDQDATGAANGGAPVTKAKLAAVQQRLSAWKEQRKDSGATAVRTSRSLAGRPGAAAGGRELKTSEDAAAEVPSCAELQAVDPRLKPPRLLVRRSCVCVFLRVCVWRRREGLGG